MTMPDREKVISKIEKEIRLGEHWGEDCLMIDSQLLRDALILLKEQEAKTPTWSCGKPFCGSCGLKIHGGKFCSECGRPIAWGER